MILKIISPQEEVYSVEVQSVTLPGTSGSFTVLDHHAPIVSLLTSGLLTYKKMDGEVVNLGTDGGIVEVNKNNITVITE